MSTVQISSFQPSISYHWPGTTATLRYTYSSDFVDSTGTPVMRGLYKDVPCTVAAGILSVPTHTIISTLDALQNPLVTLSAQFLDERGAKRPNSWLFQQFQVPTPTPTTIGALIIFNQGSSLVLPPDSYLNAQQVAALIALAVSGSGAPKMTDAIFGIGRLSLPAASAAAPIVVGDNDPRLATLAGGNLSLITTGSIVIGADSDSTGTDGISLQSRGLTRLTITNAGNVNVANFLGNNTPVPLVPLHFTVRYPVDTTAAEELIRFTTPTGTHGGITHHPFQFYQRTTVFGADRTDSVGWGFCPVGSPQGNPSLAFLMEDSFGTGAAANFELHIQYQNTTGAIGNRPWTWTFNRVTGDTFVGTSCQLITFNTGFIGDLTTNNVTFDNTHFEFNVLNGSFDLHSDDTKFNTISSAGDTAKRISILPFPTDSSLSWLIFGSIAGGGPSMARQSATQLRFYGNGNSLNPGTLEAGVFYSYGTAAFAAAPISALDGDLRFSAGLSIYFTANANPYVAEDVRITRSGVATLQMRNPQTSAASILDGIFDITTAGVGGMYKANGVQVVAARKTGWAVATGTATRTTFDTATVTTAQLAERVKALIDDLHQTAGHGLIGT